MEQKKTYPRVLTHKVLFTALIGAGCSAVGAAYYLSRRDGTLLLLSGLVFLLCLLRAVGLHRTIAAGKYEVVEGTCIGVSAKPLHRQLRVRMMDADGLETTLSLGRQAKVKIGFRYRFYFKQDQRLTLGNEFLDTALATDQLLGFEELGAFSFHDESTGQEPGEVGQQTTK